MQWRGAGGAAGVYRAGHFLQSCRAGWPEWSRGWGLQPGRSVGLERVVEAAGVCTELGVCAWLVWGSL